MAQVKICGINSAAAFDAAVDGGADWIGFNFFPPSPRFVSPAAAGELSRRHSGGPLRVGLFVNPAEAEIEAALSAVALDILQLYVDATCAGALRARFRMLVWRSVGIATPGELPAARDGIDGFVVEPKPPDGATRPGGNAVALEWGMLSSWHAPGPWLLAGGLTQANVAEAIGRSRAPAVDVSSGVEVRPGVKDPALIRAFIAAARSAA